MKGPDIKKLKTELNVISELNDDNHEKEVKEKLRSETIEKWKRETIPKKGPEGRTTPADLRSLEEARWDIRLFEPAYDSTMSKTPANTGGLSSAVVDLINWLIQNSVNIRKEWVDEFEKENKNRRNYQAVILERRKPYAK